MENVSGIIIKKDLLAQDYKGFEKDIIKIIREHAAEIEQEKFDWLNLLAAYDRPLVISMIIEAGVPLFEYTYSIPAYGFRGTCGVLGIENLPSGVSMIGSEAFKRCVNLRFIELTNVLYINERAFYECSSLEKAILPDYLDSMAANAFAYCRHLTDIKMPRTDVYRQNTFAHCESLRDIFIPDGVKMIEGACFDFMNSLTKISLPNSLDIMVAQQFLNVPGNFHIEYRGTKAQLQKMRLKDEAGYIPEPWSRVVCSDGIVNLRGEGY